MKTPHQLPSPACGGGGPPGKRKTISGINAWASSGPSTIRRRSYREKGLRIAWKIDGAPGTSGTLFEPYVFDVSGDVGPMERVQLGDAALSFGFDGIREGERVTYPFRNVQAFRKRLQELGYR